MKVFDAHCHIYPAKIARKAAQTTAAFYNYTGETLDGTVQTLFAHGGGITKFLVQSVATRPDQVQHINEFIAREVTQFPDRLYGFGALHPDSPTLEEDIAHLRALGLHGVKLHPDIQGFRLDDPRCFALAEQCEGVLPLLLHTGDSRYDFSNPNRLIPLLRRFPRLTVIGAHFGGYTIWQEAARQLAGRRRRARAHRRLRCGPCAVRHGLPHVGSAARAGASARHAPCAGDGAEDPL